MRRWVVGGVGIFVSAGGGFTSFAGRGGVSVITEVSLLCMMQLLSLNEVRPRVIGRSMTPSLRTLVRCGVRLR